MVSFLSLCLHERQDLLQGEAQVDHAVQKFLHLAPGQGLPQAADAVCVLGDEPPGGALAVDQLFPLHLHHGPLHGVGVDPRLCRQVPHRGQARSRLQGAADDALLDLGDQLGVDGGVAAKLPSHGHPSLYWCIVVLLS